MANVNTIVYQESGINQTAATTVAYPVQQNNIAPNKNPITTAVPFSLNANPISASGGGVIPLSMPPGIQPGGGPFRLRAKGTAITGGNYTLQLGIYQVPNAIIQAGTQATLANLHVVELSTARAINTTTAPWSIEALLTWDPIGSVLQGYASFLINNLLDAATAVTAVTLVAPVTSVPGADVSWDLNFVITALFGTTSAANIAWMNEFSLEGV